MTAPTNTNHGWWVHRSICSVKIGGIKMKKVWIMDIESDKFSAEDKKPINFRFATLVSESDRLLLKSKEEFEETILKLCKRNNGKNETGLIYAHNLMFDFTFCLNFLLQNGFCIKTIENGGKLISVKVFKERRKIRKDKYGNLLEKTETDTYLEFRDSYSLFQCSLKKLGQAVGLEKIEHDKNFSDEPSESDIEYCFRDCDIVLLGLKMLSKWYSEIMKEDYEIEDLPPTTASLAFHAFKKFNSVWNSDKEKYECSWILHDEDLNNLFLKQFYFGGRVELFKSELVENVHYYDINSLYPSVMISNVFHLPPYHIKLFEQNDLENQKTIGFFAIVNETNENIPLIPQHFNSGLYFPAMIKKCFIFKEEYDYLISRNVPVQLIKTLISDFKPMSPFDYLRQFYELKQKKDSLSYFYKIVLNSTYGRFGIDQMKEDFVLKPISEVKITDTGIEPINDEIAKVRKEKEMRFERNVVIASKITALARLELTKWIHKLTESNIQVYYCDTDSIVCEENSILPCDDKKLGCFKKEHSFAWFAGIGNKEYCAKIKNDNYIVKLKGVSNATLQSLFEFHENGVCQANVSKIRTMINSGILEQPFNIVMLKKNRTVYHKRNLQENKPISNFDSLQQIESVNIPIIAKTIEEIKKRVEENGTRN